jgi:hypothetical protein
LADCQQFVPDAVRVGRSVRHGGQHAGDLLVAGVGEFQRGGRTEAVAKDVGPDIRTREDLHDPVGPVVGAGEIESRRLASNRWRADDRGVDHWHGCEQIGGTLHA